MDDHGVCHNEEQDLHDALRGCLASGLTVMADGEFLTEESLADSRLIREAADWEGCCLRDDAGKLWCIQFSRLSHRNALLQEPETDPWRG